MQPAHSNIYSRGATPYAVSQPTTATPPPLTAEEQGQLDEMTANELNDESIRDVIDFAQAFARPEHPQMRQLVRNVYNYLSTHEESLSDLGLTEELPLLDSRNLSELIQGLLEQHETPADDHRFNGHAFSNVIQIIAHHVDHAPREETLPRLIEMAVDVACRDKKSAEPAHHCVQLLTGITDAELTRPNARPLARSLLALMETKSIEEILQSDLLPSLLDAIAACEDRDGTLLNEALQFVSAAVREVHALPKAMKSKVCENLTALMEHSAIPVDFKKTIATSLADAFQKSGPRGMAGLIACAPFLEEPQKERLFFAILHSNDLDSSSLVKFEKAIKCLEKKEVLQDLQNELAPRLVAAARSLSETNHVGSAGTALQLFAAYIAIHGGSPELIDDILGVVSSCDPSERDFAAVLTFQLDPHGRVMQPGTERRAVENKLNPDQLVDGTPFEYPDAIATRRTILQDPRSAGITGRIAHLMSPVPLNVLDVAQIAETYAGHPVQPSDWPRLLELLADGRR